MSSKLNDENLGNVNAGLIIDGVEYCHVKKGDTLSEIAERFIGNVNKPVEILRRDLGFEKLFPQGKLYRIIHSVDAGDIELSFII